MTPTKNSTCPAARLSLVPDASGVMVTLIDFTLSRVRKEDGEVLWDDFEDECIFEGEGTVLANIRPDVFTDPWRNNRG